MPLISLKHIEKSYGTAPVLKDINLAADEGNFLCLYGKSGCGKSTLLNILGFMDTPTKGKYLLDGKDCSGLKQGEISEIRNDKFGFVFQSFHLIPEMNAVENVCVPMGYKGVPKRERVQRAKQLLTRFGLADKFKSFPSELSGGEKQRVAIARALSNRPKIILADEPTGALDSANGKEIMDILAELNKAGTTIIMVTHDESLSHYASRIIRISDGKII